jgi:hypothetical protein
MQHIKRGEKQMSENYNTPYDDVFRTLIRDCSHLVIPVINEAFGENYGSDAEIILKENEIFLRRQNGEEEKRITDSLLEIIEGIKPDKDYHMECQSTPDGNMIVRIYEYDSQIALHEGRLKDGVLEVRFPNSAIMYLRSTKNTPDVLTIRIATPNGSVSYDVPAIKVKNYGIGEIFEKKLLFLIPFHIFAYEDSLSDIENDSTRLRLLKETYADIRRTLEDMCLSGELDEYTKCTICEMSEKVINSLARKHDKIKKEVTDVMGGKILDYEAKNILNKGVNQGENRLAQLINRLIADNRQEDIAKVTTDEAVRKEMYKKYGIVD